MKDIILICMWLSAIVIAMGSMEAQADVRETFVGPGIWSSQQNSYKLSLHQQNVLQAKLRQITGWQQLSFTESGQLCLGDVMMVMGGARGARLALLQALRSGKQFIIEDHSASPWVSFGQLDEGTNYTDDRIGLRLEIYRVRLDFADFGKMEAPPNVLEAFDEGFTFLHEVLHGLGLRDTHVPNEIGECETAVNQMRAELGLPLRDQYLADLLPVTSLIKTIRLRFKEQVLDQRGMVRWKRRHLFFVPDRLFGQEPIPSLGSSACLSLH